MDHCFPKNIREAVGVVDSPERRLVLKSLATTGLAAASGSIALPVIAAPTGQVPKKMPAKEEKEIWNACLVNCGSRCPIKCHVVDGAIRWMSHEDDNNDEFGMHQVRPCGRGRVAKKRVYNADRLKYPMKRVGKRGEGKYERISWDEAIKTIGDKLKSTIATYGNEAIYY